MNFEMSPVAGMSVAQAFDAETQAKILSCNYRCAICGCEFDDNEMLVEMKALPTYPTGEICEVRLHYECHMWKKIRQ